MKQYIIYSIIIFLDSSGTMDGSPTATSLGLERMPAEMYVPNQEQWLELRAGRNCSLCRCIE